MIFDIKLNLICKARFVAGSHWTDTEPILSYSLVVTRESVQIAFLIAVLNEIEVMSICYTKYQTAPRSDLSHVKIFRSELGIRELKNIFEGKIKKILIF
jgi:hypothetical protein